MNYFDYFFSREYSANVRRSSTNVKIYSRPNAGSTRRRTTNDEYSRSLAGSRFGEHSPSTLGQNPGVLVVRRRTTNVRFRSFSFVDEYSRAFCGLD